MFSAFLCFVEKYGDKSSVEFLRQSEKAMKEGKTTFAEIQTRYPLAFKSTALADLAAVNPIVIDWMLTGQPVARWQAERVLKMLSLVTREDYTLDTVDVVLHPETVTGD
jgi:hypothetical protein